MSNSQLKDRIKDYAYQIGINKIGFTTSEPFDYMKESLYQQKAKGFTSGFEHPNIEERLYPNLIFDKPKSIISIGLAYPSQTKFSDDYDKSEKRGKFSRASWGLDYHYILRDKLKQLAQFIENQVPKARTQYMVDTGQLVDVAVAYRAGLGFIGKNGLLISKEYGSWLYLGEIITNLEFEPDPLVDYDCGDCNRCITACPTQALLGDGRMNAKRCLSYQTQTKTLMPLEYRRKMSTVIYGCDICQLVCPYNQGIDIHDHPEMEPILDQVYPQLKPLLTLSNRQFKEKFGPLAGSWRGKKPLQRNAIIALANSNDQSALPQLIQIMEEDVRPEIRATAVWALSQIQKFYNPVLIKAVKAQMDKEEAPEIIEEFSLALDKLTRKRPPRKERSNKA